MDRCKIIAELCCNHNGDFETCKKMILSAKENGAFAVKLQKRDVDLWRDIKPDVYNCHHPVPSNSYGDTYYEHRKFLEFNINQHKVIKEYCNKIGIKYGCSVFDIPSAEQIIGINPYFIKIPSPCNNNFDLIRYVCQNFNGELHISFGMTLKEEFEKIIQILRSENAMGRTVLYVCTSGYPLESKDINLLDVKKYIELYGNECLAVGYSGHQESLAIDIASFVLGASYIERHFTLDKSQKGTDHKLSITPNELNKLCKGLNDICEAMHERCKDVSEVEISNRRKLKWINT